MQVPVVAVHCVVVSLNSPAFCNAVVVAVVSVNVSTQVLVMLNAEAVPIVMTHKARPSPFVVFSPANLRSVAATATVSDEMPTYLPRSVVLRNDTVCILFESQVRPSFVILLWVDVSNHTAFPHRTQHSGTHPLNTIVQNPAKDRLYLSTLILTLSVGCRFSLRPSTVAGSNPTSKRRTPIPIIAIAAPLVLVNSKSFCHLPLISSSRLHDASGSSHPFGSLLSLFLGLVGPREERPP